MTKFNHQQRSGKHKKPKPRKHKSLGIHDPEALEEHRELEYLRRPTKERNAKLKEIQKFNERERKRNAQ